MEKSLDYLWSSWRMEYIVGKSTEDCVFCEVLKSPDGPDNLVVYRVKYSFVILNRYPYTCGHLMVVPYTHQPSLELLTPETRTELMELTTQAIQILQKEYQPQGFNVGINIGEAAGAGILGHVHLHIVPRWGGDTNFMSTLANTRVLPENLSETYLRLKNGWIVQ